jgi:hypothetical protein
MVRNGETAWGEWVRGRLGEGEKLKEARKRNDEAERRGIGEQHESIRVKRGIGVSGQRRKSKLYINCVFVVIDGYLL